MSRARTFLAAIAAVAGVASFGCGRHDARSRAIEVAWRDGARYVYSARLTSHAGLGGQSPFDMDLTAALEIVPLSAAGARRELVVTLVDPALSVGGGAVPSADPLMAALARPLVLTLEDGRIVEERFARDLPVAAAGMQRTLAAALQLSAPPAGGSNDGWTAREYDATGAYQAAYSWGSEPGVVGKRKLQYDEVLVAGTVDAATRARVAAQLTASRGELRVKDGALASIRVADTVSSQVLMKSPLSVETRVTIDLREVAAPRADAPSRDALLAATVALAASQAYGNGAAKGLFDKARLDGRTFEQLASALEAEPRDPRARKLAGRENALPASDAERTQRTERLRSHVETMGALVALLRAQPETAAKAGARVRAASSDPDAATGILDALAAAGTDEAQAVLAALVQDAKLTTGLRVGAADSLVRVQRPSAGTTGALEQLLGDPLLREHAVFGLGTAARHLREAGDTDGARRLSDRLVALLRAADKRNDQIRCLRGIANSAYDGALEAVKPFAASPDAGVRVAALEATRLMADPAVDAVLAAPMTSDGEARVRLAAVQVAARRPPSSVLETALTGMALHDADVAARQHAVELLGRWLAQDQKLRDVLEQVVANDARAEIRETAKSALALQKV